MPLAQVIIWANSGHANPTMLLVIYGGYFIWAAVSTHLCTLLDWSASAYCSIWIVLTTESAYELWRVLIWTAQALGMRICRCTARRCCWGSWALPLPAV